MNPLSRRAFLLGGACAVASYLVYEVHTIKVVRYTVPVRNLPLPFHDFTILHLSDLHQKLFGKNQSRLLSLINRCRYDMVALTGDMVNRYNPDAKPALELINGLASKPLFFVHGNNEFDAECRNGYRIAPHLGNAGVTILDHRAVTLSRGDSRIRIAGAGHPPSGSGYLRKMLSGTADGAPAILLTHSPVIFPAAARVGIDLVLAGHTHGGQVRIPLIGTLWAPGMGIFPRWNYGEFHQGRTTLIVTGGLGESILPVRINIPPEIVLVTLVAYFE